MPASAAIFDVMVLAYPSLTMHRIVASTNRARVCALFRLRSTTPLLHDQSVDQHQLGPVHEAGLSMASALPSPDAALVTRATFPFTRIMIALPCPGRRVPSRPCVVSALD